MRTLTVELAEGLYHSLSRIAQQFGKTPKEMTAQWVETAVDRIGQDPLLALAGTLTSDVTDIGEKHDEYIGQALLKEMRGVDNE